MVNARLHVICGNCGSTEFTYARDPDPTEDCGDLTSLGCKDCATLHFLQEFNDE